MRSIQNEFKFQGQDSVGAAMAFCFFELAQHQEEQRKCMEEIDIIFGNDDRSPTMNDLKEMKHLEMCIKETLRYFKSKSSSVKLINSSLFF